MERFTWPRPSQDPSWLDNLLPLLTLRETVTLRVTCRTIRAIVADMRTELGERPVKDLKAMLTCFPKAETVELCDFPTMGEAEGESLIAWLKARGNSLTRITESGDPGGTLLDARGEPVSSRRLSACT
jgi:hypothetical protein